jgi:hypothetical protein
MQAVRVHSAIPEAQIAWQPSVTKNNLSSAGVSFDVRGELSWQDFFSCGLPSLSFL